MTPILAAACGLALLAGAAAAAQPSAHPPPPPSPSPPPPPSSSGPAPAPDEDALGPGLVQTKLVAFVRLLPRDDGKVVWEVTDHTLLRIAGCRNGWCEVVMPHAGVGWLPRNVVDPTRP